MKRLFVLRVVMAFGLLLAVFGAAAPANATPPPNIPQSPALYLESSNGLQNVLIDSRDELLEFLARDCTTTLGSADCNTTKQQWVSAVRNSPNGSLAVLPYFAGLVMNNPQGMLLVRNFEDVNIFAADDHYRLKFGPSSLPNAGMSVIYLLNDGTYGFAMCNSAYVRPVNDGCFAAWAPELHMKDSVVVGLTAPSGYEYRWAPGVWHFEGGNVTYPTGYTGNPLPQLPSPTYVAMGDSFSSGEGNLPFEDGTNEADNKCHRSESAYPQWLSQTPSLSMERMAFVACSGATTQHVLQGGSGEGSWNLPPQVDALSGDTQIVTMTIGGNDVGFKEFATECGLASCDSGTAIYATTMAAIHNDLPDRLEDVLAAVAAKTASAQVFIVGYPYVTPASGLSDLPYQCNYLNSSAGDGLDSLAAREVVDALNDELESAVSNFTNQASATTFVFVNPNSSVDGTFDGHDICRGVDSYFHNVSPDDYLGSGYRERIFHPNVYGQYEYYEIVKGAIEFN